MKRIIYTTVYNDILGSIERLGISDLDEATLNQTRMYKLKYVINDKDGGKVELYVTNNKYIKETEDNFIAENSNIMSNLNDIQQIQNYKKNTRKMPIIYIA